MRVARRLAFAVACLVACRSAETPPKQGSPNAESAAKQSPTQQESPRIEVRADRRVELITILQRLVGEREYTRALDITYVREVDAHFAPFKDHPAVAATRALRRRSITYDAPIQLAVHLDDKLALRTPPDDPRFAGIELEPYLATVRDFAAASRFDEFFTNHRAAYEQMATRLRDGIAKENPSAWFDTFFGTRPGARFITVVAPLAGTWSFAAHTGDEIYQVMGIWKVDFDGVPVVDDQVLELVVHEMAHSYVNPVLAAHRDALAPHGKRLFAQVADAMTKQAYGLWHVMIDELVVRTVTTLYLRDRKGADAAERATKREVERSFLWVPQLAELIRTRYVADRNRHSSFAAFVPELTAWLATQ